MFSDIKIEIKFCIQNNLSKCILLTKLDYDKFKLKFAKKNFLSKVKYENQIKGTAFLSNPATQTFLKLLDIRGEVLVKNFSNSVDNRVG